MNSAPALVSNGRIRAVVFDFNDTLSPSNFIEVFENFNGRLPRSGSEIVRAYVDAGLLEQLMRGKITESDFWQGVADLTGVELSLLLDVTEEIKYAKVLDEDVVAVVRELSTKNEISLALLTENVRETFDFWVEKFELNHLFPYIFNSSTYGVLKNEEKFYHIMLAELDILPQQALLIDDNPVFLRAAATIDMHTILFRGAKELRRELSQLGLLSHNWAFS